MHNREIFEGSCSGKRLVSLVEHDIKELQILILRLCIEAGAVLVDVRQVAMAKDTGIGVVNLQRAEQGHQGCLLFPRTGIGWFPFRCQATFVANANRVLIVMSGVCPRQVLMPRLVHLSLTGDVVVVAGEPEAGVVTGDEILDREAAVTARGRAVNDDEIYASHFLSV